MIHCLPNEPVLRGAAEAVRGGAGRRRQLTGQRAVEAVEVAVGEPYAGYDGEDLASLVPTARVGYLW